MTPPVDPPFSGFVRYFLNVAHAHFVKSQIVCRVPKDKLFTRRSHTVIHGNRTHDTFAVAPLRRTFCLVYQSCFLSNQKPLRSKQKVNTTGRQFFPFLYHFHNTSDLDEGTAHKYVKCRQRVTSFTKRNKLPRICQLWRGANNEYSHETSRRERWKTTETTSCLDDTHSQLRFYVQTRKANNLQWKFSTWIRLLLGGCWSVFQTLRR